MSEQVGEENRAWINDALTGEDLDRRDFAADYLAHIGRKTGFDIGEVLSEKGRDRYLALAQERYEAAGHPDPGPRRSSDARLDALAAFATTEGNWGVPPEIAASVLVDISRSIDSNDEQREALNEYISRVVTPFNRTVGQRLEHAVSALRAGRENIGEIPGQFAFLLSDEQLIEAAVARGGDRLNYFSEPIRPEGLDWIDHVIGIGGVGLGAGGVISAGVSVALPAALLGLGGSAGGYAMAINDANEEHNEYLINMEIYSRFQNPGNRASIRAFEKKIRVPFPGNNNGEGESVRDPTSDFLDPP